MTQANNLSEKQIREKLRGESLGSVFSSKVRGNLDASSTKAGKERLADRLAGKSLSQRKAVYKELGIGGRGIQRIESMIVGKREPTRMEKKMMRRKQESKKRRNIMMSKRSAEESGGISSSGGATGYEESTGEFAGGQVRTKSRVSMVGRKADKNESGTALGGAKKKGFALDDPGSKRGFAGGKGASGPSKGGFAGKPSKKSGLGGPSTPGGGGRPLGF